MNIILIGMLVIAWKCHVDRDCFICSETEWDCSPELPAHDTLFITGFENGEDPTEFGGVLDVWNDTLSGIEVQVSYDSTGGGAWGSRYYAKLMISGNGGHSTVNWSGGGLVLIFSDCPGGVDISDYDSIQFEVKVFPGSNLDETRVKLEDTTNDSIPERFLLKFSHSPFPSPVWTTVSVPICEFEINVTDPIIHPSWVALDNRKVVRMVTTLINTPTSGDAKDGAMGVDNVRFVKK